MKKSLTLILALIVVISMLAATAVFASAESTFEPSGNIEWYITSSPGGGSDIYTRKIIEIISGNGYITYDGTGDAITALLGGHVDLLISKPAAASEYVEAGSIQAILALSTERYGGKLADAPTLSEVGDYNDVEVPVWRGVAAPGAMSDEAAAFWSEILRQVSESDQWKEEYLDKNMLIGNYMDLATAQEYMATYQADYLASLGQ